MNLGGRLVTGEKTSTSREWLVTNGLGGYASGTVSGVLTRRYHGLLVAATHPPVGRTVLLTKVEETVEYAGRSYELSADRWNRPDGPLHPAGQRYLVSFRLDGSIPVWQYRVADAIIEKQVWMRHGANVSYVRYRYLQGSGSLRLVVKALVNHRDHHATTRSDGWQMEVRAIAGGVRVDAFDGATPLLLSWSGETVLPRHEWYRQFFLAEEHLRGLDDRDDNLLAAELQTALDPGGSVALTATAGTNPAPAAGAALVERVDRDRELLSGAAAGAPDRIGRLVLAADQFIVTRRLPDGEDGLSVIAGYHWFGDWGRDTMIALPGLTLPTGRPGVAARILRTFARYVDRGMLPNNFPEAGQAPGYNTVDAALWYPEVVRAYHEATGDTDLVRELFPVMAGIVEHYTAGTRFGIAVDPADGLVASGEPGVQLTWMDARVGDRVITPRTGKAVEINALWHNALESMAAFAGLIGEPSRSFEEAAARVRASYARFWNDDTGYCFDVLDGPDGDDPSLRPNQVLAVALHHSPLPAERQRAVVDVCARRLLTPMGLRSLADDHPDYAGHYGGGPAWRDAVYHQGTVWPWLIGPFVAAHLRVYGDPAAAARFLDPLSAHLVDYGVGTIAEIADGDPPHTPKGAIAQAWSVAEVLRAWTLCGRTEP